MGMEGAGVVEKVGDAQYDHLVGKKVSFLAKGAWAQYVNAQVATLIEFEDETDFDDICYA